MAHDRELMVRQAACLDWPGSARRPLEALGRALLERKKARPAARALACHPDEGFNMLRDASEVENLLTRRAAVFGLARVPEAWAMQILEKVSVDDEQWVVRGAAAEAAERRRNPPWRIPAPVQDPSQLPWLIAFAGKLGSGMAPGKAAMEMLRRRRQRHRWSRSQRSKPLSWMDASEFEPSQQALRSDQAFLRDAAFESLWRQAGRRRLISAWSLRCDRGPGAVADFPPTGR
jgi:hypothetical protein